MKKISLIIMILACASYGFSQEIEKSEVKLEPTKELQLQDSKAENVKADFNVSPTKKQFDMKVSDLQSSPKVKDADFKLPETKETEIREAELKSPSSLEEK